MINTIWTWLVDHPGPTAIMLIVDVMLLIELHTFSYRDDAGWRGRSARALQTRGLTLLTYGGAR